MAELIGISIVRKFDLRNERAYVRALWISAFAVLTAVGAQIELPYQPVPFTLQTFFVLLTGAFLGRYSGPASSLLYLLMGSVGLPVFSGGAFGLAKIAGPTGGYLLAFPVATAVIGYLVELRKEFWWILISMLFGSLIVFLGGTVQLNFVYFHDWNRSVQSGFLIFSVWDGVKIVAATSIVHYYYRKLGPS
jgi:biotin transport system substrate-specific component